MRKQRGVRRLALLMALVIATVTCVSVKKAYSMKKKSVDYPLDQFAKLELTEESDDFLGSASSKSESFLAANSRSA